MGAGFPCSLSQQAGDRRGIAGFPCSLSHAHTICHVLTSGQEAGARWGQASPARSASRQETDAG